MTRAPKTWRTWTRKELDRLESLRLEGRTAKEISAALGRTLPAVKCRITQEGCWLARRLMRWLPILCKPHTIAGAAAEAGTTKWAVKQAKRKLRRAGFEVPAANRTPPPARGAT